MCLVLGGSGELGGEAPNSLNAVQNNFSSKFIQHLENEGTVPGDTRISWLNQLLQALFQKNRCGGRKERSGEGSGESLLEPSKPAMTPV